MSLSPGQWVGYDDARRMFRFTMLNGAEVVQCEISSSALDDLAGGVTGGPAGRESQFLTVRREIEHVASAIFDDGPSDNRGVDLLRIYLIQNPVGPLAQSPFPLQGISRPQG
jgi:Protein of unknown function (DUF1488)